MLIRRTNSKLAPFFILAWTFCALMSPTHAASGQTLAFQSGENDEEFEKAISNLAREVIEVYGEKPAALRRHLQKLPILWWDNRHTHPKPGIGLVRGRVKGFQTDICLSHR